jgi:hypothetical protein
MKWARPRRRTSPHYFSLEQLVFLLFFLPGAKGISSPADVWGDEVIGP